MAISGKSVDRAAECLQFASMSMRLISWNLVWLLFTHLGLANARTTQLVERLLHWQWTRRMNPWITVDALAVLRAANRFRLPA
jgi:hypothetical protein